MPEIEQVLRLSPSGPPLENSGGAPIMLGPGARLRMVDTATPLGVVNDNSEIPTLAAVVTFDGFGGSPASPVLLNLPKPNPALYYRAQVQVDVIATTDDDATVQVFLDVNLDPTSSVWTNVASNTHKVRGVSSLANGTSQVSLSMNKTLGSALGITAETANLAWRVRMACPENPIARLYSPTTPAPGAANSKGTFYFMSEELF
jgi:hypothetical protein